MPQAVVTNIKLNDNIYDARQTNDHIQQENNVVEGLIKEAGKTVVLFVSVV